MATYHRATDAQIISKRVTNNKTKQRRAAPTAVLRGEK